MRLKARPGWRCPRIRPRYWHCRVLQLLLLVATPFVIVHLLTFSVSVEQRHKPHIIRGFDPARLAGANISAFDMLPVDMVQRYLTGRLSGVSNSDLQKPYSFREYWRLALSEYNRSYTAGHQDSNVVFSWQAGPNSMDERPGRAVLTELQNGRDSITGINIGRLEFPDMGGAAANGDLRRESDNQNQDVDATWHTTDRRSSPFKGISYKKSFTKTADETDTWEQETKQLLNAEKDLVDKSFHRYSSKLLQVNRLSEARTHGKDHTPICPLEYHIKRCSILLVTDSTMKMKLMRSRITPVRDPVRRGSIVVNGNVIQRWDTKEENLFIVRLDEQCHILEKYEFAINTHRKREVFSSEASQYLQNLPTGAVIAGVAYGITDVLFRTELPNEGSYPRTTPRDMCMTSFVNLQGNPGLSWKHIDSGRDYHAEEASFHFGHPFNPSLVKTGYESVVRAHPDVSLGGYWRPSDCEPRSRIAVIVPFRARETHLILFLLNMIQFLKKQYIEHQIFVVEQTGPELFNRAALMNVGYLAARGRGFDCYVFHDVDQIPEDLANWYHCGPEPRHLMASRSYTGYRLRFPLYFGGAISLTSELIEEMNGFPNRWFGWGGEDDDMYGRLLYFNHTLQRLPLEIGRYKSLPHEKEEATNPHLQSNMYVLSPNSRVIISKSGSSIREAAGAYIDTDGLSTLNVTAQRTVLRELYTHVYVQIPGPTTAEEEQARRWHDPDQPALSVGAQRHGAQHITMATTCIVSVLVTHPRTVLVLGGTS